MLNLKKGLVICEVLMTQNRTSLRHLPMLGLNLTQKINPTTELRDNTLL